VIGISLDNANEALQIRSNGATYALTSNNNFVDGSLGTAFTGYGSTSGTLNPTGFTTINVTDATTGTSVTFQDSVANAYAQIFNVNLTNAAAGNIVFNGTSTFNDNLTASTTVGAITVSAGATLNLNGATSILQSTSA